ncbi:hypothetical protein [Oceanibacterium hippocampi]|uniref:Uncharacterized protein n=1 Tax=Oceanibacterium hippocampi TaxID=745714 RepID=A0A1Y5S0P9_9PROT|nr:hypothetical protein [Oceanibacterium hippocampi]SLN29672.1 hypothetical protein OCH7691_01021 [Oceanibacterium hippocampi]
MNELSGVIDILPAAKLHYAGQMLGYYGVELSALPQSLRAADVGERWLVPDNGPPVLQNVMLPDFAADIAIDGALLIPASCIADPTGGWHGVDWFAVIAWYLHAVPERAHEARRGPIHSYAARLGNWDSRLWEHAWANRAAMFLRRAAAHLADRDETDLFGAFPEARLELTHDVDAIAKTGAIRLKQAVFSLVNVGRHVGRRRPGAALVSLWRAFRFLCWPSRDYWNFDRIMAVEKAAGLRSTFLFYVRGRRARGRAALRRRLFDPGYDAGEVELAGVYEAIRKGGWSVGLHPSFDSWNAPVDIRSQRHMLQRASGVQVRSCRQHWLRFSWERTWRAQVDAGLELDYTLCFNERPGFRISAAVTFDPLDEESGYPVGLRATPTILMDSHLYDYGLMDARERRRTIVRLLDEVHAVGGEAAILWHPHVLSRDYGWADGFTQLLEEMVRIARRPHPVNAARLPAR